MCWLEMSGFFSQRMTWKEEKSHLFTSQSEKIEKKHVLHMKVKSLKRSRQEKKWLEYLKMH